MAQTDWLRQLMGPGMRIPSDDPPAPLQRVPEYRPRVTDPFDDIPFDAGSTRIDAATQAPAHAGLNEAANPNWRPPTSAEGGARTRLGRWWDERDVRKAEKAIAPGLEQVSQDEAARVAERTTQRARIASDYDRRIAAIRNQADNTPGLDEEVRETIRKQANSLEQTKRQRLEEYDKLGTAADDFTSERAAAQSPLDEARANLQQRANRRATNRANRLRRARGGAVGLGAAGLFSSGVLLANWWGTEKAKAHAKDHRAREADELTDRLLGGETLNDAEQEFLSRYMGPQYDAVSEIARRAAAGDPDAAQLARDLRSGEIITQEEIEEEAEELGEPDAEGFPTDEEVLEMDRQRSGDVEPVAPEDIGEDTPEPTASRSLDDLFSMAAHASEGPADPTLIDEQVALDQEAGYQAFDDALMGAIGGVNPDAALTRDLDELQRYAAGEDTEILPDQANALMRALTGNPLGFDYDLSREPPYLTIGTGEGRPADDALAGVYMDAQDLANAGRQSDLLGPVFNEALGMDPAGSVGARPTPETTSQEEMLANQAILDERERAAGERQPTLTGARDLRDIPIDPVQYRMLADELGYAIDEGRTPDPRLYERMVGEMERRRTGGSPIERPPAPVTPADPQSPRDQAMMDELGGGFVPPRRLDQATTDVEEAIRKLIQNDEVNHPRGQDEPMSDEGEDEPSDGGLGRLGPLIDRAIPMIDSAVLGAGPADAREASPDAGGPAAAGELEAEAAAAAAAREAERGRDFSWGSPLVIGDSPIGRWGKEQLGFDEDAEVRIPSMKDMFGWDMGDVGTADAEEELPEMEDVPPGSTTSLRAGGTSNAGAGGGDYNASREADPASLADDAEAAEEELNWINRQMRDRFGMDASERARAAQSMIAFGTTMARSPGTVLEGFNEGAAAGLEEFQDVEERQYDRSQDAWERAQAEDKARREEALASIRKRSDMSKLEQVLEMQQVFIDGGWPEDEALEMAERYAGVRNEEAWRGGGNDWASYAEADAR